MHGLPDFFSDYAAVQLKVNLLTLMAHQGAEDLARVAHKLNFAVMSMLHDNKARSQMKQVW